MPFLEHAVFSFTLRTSQSRPGLQIPLRRPPLFPLLQLVRIIARPNQLTILQHPLRIRQLTPRHFLAFCSERLDYRLSQHKKSGVKTSRSSRSSEWAANCLKFIIALVFASQPQSTAASDTSWTSLQPVRYHPVEARNIVLVFASRL